MSKTPKGVFPAFHDRFMTRLVSFNIMDSSAVVAAQNIAEDGLTKVPADKITSIGKKLLDVIDVAQKTESQYVGQALPFLQQADAGLKAQIKGYRLNGDLSDDDKSMTASGAETDKIGNQTDLLDIDPTLAARELGGEHATGNNVINEQ